MRLWTRCRSVWSQICQAFAAESLHNQGRCRALRLEGLEDRCLLSGVQGDFNGDGYGDLAIGNPGATVGAVVDAGSISVLYGSELGGLDPLAGPGNQIFNQNSTGMGETAESGDHFGAAIAVGDFNGDGFDDVAIGAPEEDLSTNTISNAGAVHVLYGSANGLNHSAGPGVQLWTQDSGGIKDKAEAGDRFGTVLAAGDFNGDGYADLAVGIPQENVNSAIDGGAVQILYGSAHGLTDFDQFLNQDTEGIRGSAEHYDNFGASLAVGDFNHDGHEDLAVGVSNESIGDRSGAGGVAVFLGTAGGLTVDGNQFWSQDSADIAGKAEVNDRFGTALAAGDFNHDGFDDLAIGVPGEDLGATVDAGAVNVIYGSATGLTAAGNQFLSQGWDGLTDVAQAGDRFGAALTAAPNAFAGYDALAIGVPGEDANALTAEASFSFTHAATEATTGTINLTTTPAAPALQATSGTITTANGTVSIDAVAGEGYDGAAGNLTVDFVLNGGLGSAATASVSGGVLTIEFRDTSTTLGDIETAVEGINDGGTAAGDFAVTVSSGGAFLDNADDAVSGALTGGADATAATTRSLSISAVAGEGYAGSAGNLSVLFDVDGTIGSAATASVTGTTLTVKVRDAGTTLGDIETAVEAIDAGGTAAGDFAVTVSSAATTFNLADDNATSALTGGTDAGSATISVASDTAGAASNGVNVSFAPDLTIANNTATAAITGGNIVVGYRGTVSYAAIAAAINGLAGYSASVTASAGGTSHFAGVDADPPAANLAGGAAGIVDSGAVQIVFGSANGLAANAGPGNVLLHQDSPGMAGNLCQVGDAFGSSLTAGVFDDSGFVSLVIGTPLEDNGVVVDAGAVTVLRGSVAGLTTAGSQFFQAGVGGLLGTPENDGHFGAAL